MNSGIYKITHTASGRSYVGQAQDISKRIARHLNNLHKGRHPSDHLQKAWLKYGEAGFEFSTIEHCTLDLLDEREQFWIDSSNSEFNKCKFVKSFWRGQKHTDETKAKIAIRQIGNDRAKGNVLSQETRERMRQAQLGRKHSPETKSKIGASNKGLVHTPETKAKLSKAQRGNKYRLGQSPSQETREKLSAANRRWWDLKRQGKV